SGKLPLWGQNQEDVSTGTEIADSETGWGVRTNLRMIMDYMTDLNLRVSQQTTTARWLAGMIKEFDESDEEAVLAREQSTNLNNHVRELRQPQEQELPPTYAHAVT